MPCPDKVLVQQLPRTAIGTIIAISILLATTAPRADAAGLAFTAIADARVDERDPTTNFRSYQLKIRAAPAMRAFIKFNVTGLQGSVTRATLTLDPLTSSVAGFRVRRASDNWDEDTITWETAPAREESFVDSGRYACCDRTSADVTQFVQGAGDVTLVVSTLDPLEPAFKSREYGSSDAPQLVVETVDSGGSTTPVQTTPPTGLLLSDGFDTANGGNRVITNEVACGDRYSDGVCHATGGVQSPIWQITSGSLFSQNGMAWSGRPDLTSPGTTSINGTDSQVLRVRTRRADFGSVRQEIDARINWFCGDWLDVSCDRSRDFVAWDGVVLWPRYATEFNLYFGYLLRKDGKVLISKKCPDGAHGGSDSGQWGSHYNGGYYYSLTSENAVAADGSPIPQTTRGRWYHLTTEVRDNPDGSVTVKMLRDGRLLKSATDTGVGCAPIHGPTRLGFRGDNVDVNVDNYAVTALP